MSNEMFGPIAFLIGTWESVGFTGENQAMDPEREVENTHFRQTMTFTPTSEVANHEQELAVLRYSTMAWEEGDDEDPFHEEVGYFIWDETNKQLLKSFIVPRGIAVNAGGSVNANAEEFTLSAELGSHTYGLCSNKFLDEQFKTIRYDVTFTKLDENHFKYSENTQIQMPGRDKIFDHTESNILKKIS